jgi:hypothetical protein
VHKEIQELKVQSEHKVHKVILELKETQVLKVPKEI